MDDSRTDELAYSIGEAKTLDEVTPSALDAFFQALGIENAAGRRRLAQRYVREIGFALAGRLKALEKKEKRFADLIASNIRILLGALEIEIPEAARERDALISKAGGWHMS